MKKEYVVVEPDGISWNPNTEKPERFRSLDAAKKRATELADDQPGQEIGIYELAHVAIAHVQPVKMTSR